MKLNIEDVESDTSHAFFGEDSFLGDPLEGAFHVILDFGEVLDGTGLVDKKVGSGVFGAEGPELSGVVLFPLVFVDEGSGGDLDVILSSDDSVLDVEGEFFLKGLSNEVELVMLVGGFGETGLGASGSDGFLVRNDGVGLDDFDVGVFFNEIFQADFQVEFSATGDNVFGFSGDNLDQGVGLGHLFKSVDELGEIGGVLGSDGDSDDRGDRVLHGLDSAGLSAIGDGSLLDKALINSDQGAGVTARDIEDVFGSSSHHEDDSLNVLFKEVFLLSGLVVGTENSDFLSLFDLSGENSSEGVESTSIASGNHLGDEHHERSIGIAIDHSLGALVVHGSFIEVEGSVFLSGSGGR